MDEHDKQLCKKTIENFREILKTDAFQEYTLDCVFETSTFGTYSECVDIFVEYIDSMADKLIKEIGEN